MAVFEVTCIIPYALRNAGTVRNEMAMRRKAADYIEHLEDEMGKLALLLDEARVHLPPECGQLRSQIEDVLRPKKTD